ncbi:hypothetical protein [Methylobacterium sp. Leaf112]|uniref:hypothetical protein n=1 Tax=Methylobacterium sp. Leaf112 TaxID=1736258 RepID=UPI000B0CD99B|nr:hypothetical protein [Methylobacterium sp. Leaf112]
MANKLDPNALYRMQFPEDPLKSTDLFKQYEISITIDNMHTINIGRFSTPIVNRLTVIGRPITAQIFKCGAFCEAATDAQIVVSGEHSNNRSSNITFGSLGDVYALFLSEDERKAYAPNGPGSEIGNNVILSTSSVVLGGTIIGDGTLVAAGAVVTSDCEPRSIYGGVPAKKIRDRFDASTRDHFDLLKMQDIRGHCVHLINQWSLLLEKGMSFESLEIEHMPRRPRIQFEGTIGPDRKVKFLNILGYWIGDEAIVSPKIKQGLDDYFNQLLKPNVPVQWSPDIFYAMGIT